MDKLTVEDLDVKGKRVLMRVDFNVPLEDGRVANDKRIRAALPTINYITNKGGKLILMSHLGRPKGKRVPEMSLAPCVTVLNALLGRKTKFVEDCIGPAVESAVDSLGEGQILLLENLRYYTQETDNDLDFASKLATISGGSERSPTRSNGPPGMARTRTKVNRVMKPCQRPLQNPAGPPLVSAEAGARAVALNPNIEFVVVTDGSHSMHRDAYPAFWEAVSGFLR